MNEPDAKRLVQAAFAGKFDEVKQLLEHCSNIDLESGGWNALHAAIENQQIKCVKLLIDFGADVERVNGSLTPLAHAVDIALDSANQLGTGLDNRSIESVLALLEAGAHPKSGLTIALNYQSSEMKSLLLPYLSQEESKNVD